MTELATPRAVEELDVRVVGDETLVHHPSSGKIHVLNDTAGEVLRLCDGRHSQAEIAKQVAQEHGAEEPVVVADVARILDEFRRLGLVVG